MDFSFSFFHFACLAFSKTIYRTSECTTRSPSIAIEANAGFRTLSTQSLSIPRMCCGTVCVSMHICMCVHMCTVRPVPSEAYMLCCATKVHYNQHSHNKDWDSPYCHLPRLTPLPSLRTPFPISQSSVRPCVRLIRYRHG